MTPDEQLAAVLSALAALDSTTAVGVYLAGSAMEGGLRPASDLDVLAIIDRPLARDERWSLAERLRENSGRRAKARPLECIVLVASDVIPWRYPPVMHFLYGEWMADEIAARGVAEPAPNPDLAILLTQARRSSRTLVGAPAQELLESVPAEDVAAACRAAIPELLASMVGDERNVVLTLARLWCTLATGEIVSKDAAADWASPRVPADLRPVLDHARGLYLTTTYGDEVWPPELGARLPELASFMASAADG